MPAPLNLSSYPQFFWDIEAALIESGPQFPSLRLDCQTRGKAVHLRQRFYSWRQLRLAHGGAPVLSAIRIRMELPSTIIFEHSDDNPQLEAQLRAQGLGTHQPSPGLAALATAAEGGAPQGAPQPQALEPQTTAQEQEAVLKKLGLI